MKYSEVGKNYGSSSWRARAKTKTGTLFPSFFSSSGFFIPMMPDNLNLPRFALAVMAGLFVLIVSIGRQIFGLPRSLFP